MNNPYLKDDAQNNLSQLKDILNLLSENSAERLIV
jgi:hypothetical protein